MSLAANTLPVMRAAMKVIRVLEAPLRIIWRLGTGHPLDGVPRSDATWFCPGTRALSQDEAGRPPERFTDEVRADVRSLRADWRRHREGKLQ